MIDAVNCSPKPELLNSQNDFPCKVVLHTERTAPSPINVENYMCLKGQDFIFFFGGGKSKKIFLSSTQI